METTKTKQNKSGCHPADFVFFLAVFLFRLFVVVVVSVSLVLVFDNGA